MPGADGDQSTLQLPAFSQGWYFSTGKGIPVAALDWSGLAEGGSAIFSLDILEGRGVETETCLYVKLYGH